MKQRGFTLMEILVALAVVGIGLAALIGTAGHATRDAAALRDRTYAEWVAANAMTEIRLEQNFPDTGKRDGDEILGGQRWFWNAEISTTPDPDLRRIDVRVSLEKNGGSIVLLSGFMARPAAAP